MIFFKFLVLAKMRSGLACVPVRIRSNRLTKPFILKKNVANWKIRNLPCASRRFQLPARLKKFRFLETKKKQAQFLIFFRICTIHPNIHQKSAPLAAFVKKATFGIRLKKFALKEVNVLAIMGEQASLTEKRLKRIAILGILGVKSNSEIF